MTASESIPCYDLLVSLDRSDRTAALALFDLSAGSFLSEAPQQFPGAASTQSEVING